MKKISYNKTKKIGKLLTLLSLIILVFQIMPSVNANHIFEKYNINKKYISFENSDVRFPAEFETIKELMITWPKENVNLDGGYTQESYYIDLVKSAEDATKINIIVNNVFIKNRVISKLKQNDIALSNVTFTLIFTNSIWVRDYGPFFIEKNNDLSIIDFHYYRKILFSRPIDDLFPSIFGLKNNLKFNFLPNFLTTLQGGNFMSNGIGTGFIADRIYEKDNPKLSKEMTNNFIKYFLGLNNLIVLKSQVIKVSMGGDETGHIDMYAKLIDKESIIVAKWLNQKDVNYQILEDNAQTLENMGYNVIRIPILRNPKDDKIIWTYTNSLIINGTSKDVVLVPIYNTTEDKIAISIYQQAMPDYEIRPVNCETIIQYYGAIHCTTMTVPLIDKH